MPRWIDDAMGRLCSRAYAWACQRLYHELAWAYDWVSLLVSAGRWPHWRRLALDFIGPGPGVELGFGTGALLAELTHRGIGPVIGVEPSWAMQQVARRRFARCPQPPIRLQARAQALPLADASMDWVLATFPAPYILEEKTLDECRRVLRLPTGRLVVVGLWVDLTSPWRRLMPAFYGRPSSRQVSTWEARLVAAGFTPTWNEVVDGPARVAVLVANLAPGSQGVADGVSREARCV
ncbi:MAG: hypothetical protein KatS3mg050_1828 [Litorilinea sp.]|nr:MAG: hypothetical protein KatS3mg050_1828 [Litorilinea sp.]